ncbi:MAG: hypothetical protein IPM56_16210 [Ignavibacteriales bacterium]|nr:MAG: hypothetical protein IPM56_16210 [Ignavibacteriales bacterium]
MFEKLKALLTKLGFNLEGKETELKTEIEKLEKTNDGIYDFSKLDLSKFKDDGNKELIEAVVNQNKILTEKVTTLLNTIGQEQTQRENANKAAADQAKKDFEKKVDDAVEKLFTDKKITEADKKQWKEDYTANFEMTERFAAKLTPPKQLAGKTTADDKTKTTSTTATPDKKESPHKVLTDAIREQMETSKTV